MAGIELESTPDTPHYSLHQTLLLDREFRPLRIFLYYDPVSIEPLDVDKQIFINTMQVQPLLLGRFGLTSSCVDQCKTIPHVVSIPDEHLFQCRYCALPNPLACTSSGPPDGEGINDADFLLYVSAVDSVRCKNEDTIAYAAHCQQEAELDRPIAGDSAFPIKHEILHALGFSAGLYAFFRDSNGQPRTKRNRYNRPISFNRDRGYYDADDSTILTKMRTDWWTAENRIPHPVHLMVVEEARKHFGCEALEGAELENQAEMALH
uniref:Leishmanolysin-like peptidase n=1 Tax=Ditylenchus dipsaci TaxID=166011 RepID=A0A915CUQ0_9BILA